MTRRRALVLILVIAVASGAIGWMVADRIKSPAQIAAETEPPEPAWITVPVELVEIRNDVVSRGTAELEGTHVLDSPVVTANGLPPIVTEVPDVGSMLVEGDVVAALADRPVIALEGDRPLFADRVVGDQGSDIAGLQRALARLGHWSGPIDGRVVEAMLDSVDDLYEDRGFESIEGLIPAAELTFFDKLPLRVDEVRFGTGEEATGELVRLSAGTIAVHTVIPAGEAGLVDAGMTAEIEHDLLTGPINGTITVVALVPGTNGADSAVTIELDDAPPDLAGANVKVTIPIAARSSSGSVLAVPPAALSTNAAGTTSVSVLLGEDLVPVSVRPGLSDGRGLVEVTAIDGDLSVGDEVVVGRDPGQQNRVATST